LLKKNESRSHNITFFEHIPLFCHNNPEVTTDQWVSFAEIQFFFTAILGEIVFGAPNCDFFCAGTEDHLAADQSFRVLAMAEGIVMGDGVPYSLKYLSSNTIQPWLLE